jgi:hypothetical protein
MIVRFKKLSSPGNRWRQVTAICLYKRKLADIIKKVQGVAIKNILPDEKYPCPKMKMLSRIEKGIMVQSMMDRSLDVYRGNLNIAL